MNQIPELFPRYLKFSLLGAKIGKSYFIAILKNISDIAESFFFFLIMWENSWILVFVIWIEKRDV